MNRDGEHYRFSANQVSRSLIVNSLIPSIISPKKFYYSRLGKDIAGGFTAEMESRNSELDIIIGNGAVEAVQKLVTHYKHLYYFRADHSKLLRRAARFLATEKDPVKKQDRRTIFRFLLNSGEFDPSANSNEICRTFAQYGLLDDIKYLTVYCAGKRLKEFNPFDMKGIILKLAARGLHFELVEYLLILVADASLVESYGFKEGIPNKHVYSVLFMSIRYGFVDQVDCILTLFPTLDLSSRGCAAFIAAMKHRQYVIFEKLIFYANPENDLGPAIFHAVQKYQADDMPFVKMILEKGFFHRRGSKYLDALVHSVSMDYTDWFRILFPYYKLSDHSYSLLFFAVKKKRRNIIGIMDEISTLADTIPFDKWIRAIENANDDDDMKSYLSEFVPLPAV